MRVILTQNVPKLGEVGDVCDVAPGYGRNFLIPQRLAIPATKGALKQVVDLKRTEERRQNRIRSDMQALVERLEALDLRFTAKVGQTGRLYGSITSSDIADKVEQELGEAVDRRKILLDESLRSLGEHKVPIHLMPGLDAQLTVIVEPDEELVEDVALEETDFADVDTPESEPTEETYEQEEPVAEPAGAAEASDEE